MGVSNLFLDTDELMLQKLTLLLLLLSSLGGGSSATGGGTTGGSGRASGADVGQELLDVLALKSL